MIFALDASPLLPKIEQDEMKKNDFYTPPPAIAYVRRKARVTEATARVIASLNGMSVPDEWIHLGAVVAQTLVSSAWRGA